MAKSRKAAIEQAADQSGTTRRQTAPHDEIKVTWRIPKHADAKSDNPDDWTELGPGEPLPEPYRRRITEAFAPMVWDFLHKFHLTGDDFDQESWTEFVRAFFDSLPERVCSGPKGEKTERLIRVLRRVLEKKFGPIPDPADVPAQGQATEVAPPAREAKFTRRQGQYLAFINQFRQLHRRGPDEADLAGYFGVTPQSACQTLAKLESLGLITREAGVPCSARVAIPAEKLPALDAVEGSGW
jgi:repressor LexA